MGHEAQLGPFDADDSFLRHIDRKRRVMDDGVVSWEVFKPREGETALSFTFQDAYLKTPAGLDRYQRDKALPHGDLPGICRLTYDDLTEGINPPLLPRPAANPDDPTYGRLHCVTDLPTGEQHMTQMAKLATRNGLLRAFARSPK